MCALVEHGGRPAAADDQAVVGIRTEPDLRRRHAVLVARGRQVADVVADDLPPAGGC